jgi:hypothetical protein
MHTAMLGHNNTRLLEVLDSLDELRNLYFSHLFNKVQISTLVIDLPDAARRTTILIMTPSFAEPAHTQSLMNSIKEDLADFAIELLPRITLPELQLNKARSPFKTQRFHHTRLAVKYPAPRHNIITQYRPRTRVVKNIARYRLSE